MADAELTGTGEAEGDLDGASTAPRYDDTRQSPERLLFLADGVFAISMTLLAIDVRIPEGLAETRAAYAEHSGQLYKELAVFLAAFVITSRFWVTNHRQMRMLHHTDSGLISRMVLFLAGICSIPVATSVLFRFGEIPAAITFAAVVLGGTAILSSRVWWYMTDPRRDLARVDAHDRRRVMTRMMLVTAVYLAAIPVAWVLPDASLAPLIWLLMAVIDNVADRLNDLMERRAAR